MKIPIRYALTYPERPPAPYPRVDFGTLREMTFFAPDLEKFRCLALAYRALETGGTAPAVLNAANEVAVDLFLDERLPFTEIPRLIEEALAAHAPVYNVTLDDLVRADREARDLVLHRAAAYSRTEGSHASS
jgi:1-deoxy-D-xylulose-5-phosphate reductoisomerase